MRRRASRIAIFAAVVAAHLLALHFFPDFRRPAEPMDQELTLPIALFPVKSQEPSAENSRERVHSSKHRRKQLRSKREARIAPAVIVPPEPRSARPWVDWEKEANAAIGDDAEHASEAARRSSALSRWREHVMPGPPPRAPEFRWDETRSSQRFVPSIAGLVIHLNDRCELIISPLALLGGCAIGHIPVYNDLFAHMDDPKPPGESSVPSNPP